MKVVIRMSAVDGEPRMAIDVIDNGIGIAEDKVATVFEPFAQADSSTTRRYGGTGLGLDISRRFARVMGGDIVATSGLGEGSTFTATIDPDPPDDIRMLEPDEARAAMEEIVDESHVKWQFNAGRVLVVDDGDENREFVQLVLEEAGLEVDQADNGKIGFDMARETACDVVLMDMQMPVMDGYEATAALRAAGVDTPTPGSKAGPARQPRAPLQSSHRASICNARMHGFGSDRPPGWVKWPQTAKVEDAALPTSGQIAPAIKRLRA